MTALPMHKEDIKAILRKRFGSLAGFEAAKTLPARSVTDILRGKSVRRAAEAVAEELGFSVHALFPGRYSSADADCINAGADSHHLNAEAE